LGGRAPERGRGSPETVGCGNQWREKRIGLMEKIGDRCHIIQGKRIAHTERNINRTRRKVDRMGALLNSTVPRREGRVVQNQTRRPLRERSLSVSWLEKGIQAQAISGVLWRKKGGKNERGRMKSGRVYENKPRNWGKRFPGEDILSLFQIARGTLLKSTIKGKRGLETRSSC